MEFDAILLAIRWLSHVICFLVLVSFRDQSATHRPGVSWFAVGLMASNLALAWQILTTWPALLAAGAQWPLTVFCVCVCAAVIYTRGNVARLLPRIPWSHR